jgi:hypothetical protein
MKGSVPLFHPSYFIIHTFLLSSRRDLHQLEAVTLGETDGMPFRAEQGLTVILHEHEGRRKGEFGKKSLERRGYDLFGFTVDREKGHGAERQKAE